MTQIVIPDLTVLLAFLGICGVVFSVYLYFRNPQIKTDQVTLKLQEDMVAIKKELTEVKENHIRSIESDVKALTQAVNDLSKTVIKLSTIIDERIPKNNVLNN